MPSKKLYMVCILNWFLQICNIFHLSVLQHQHRVADGTQDEKLGGVQRATPWGLWAAGTSCRLGFNCFLDAGSRKLYLNLLHWAIAGLHLNFDFIQSSCSSCVFQFWWIEKESCPVFMSLALRMFSFLPQTLLTGASSPACGRTS